MWVDARLPLYQHRQSGVKLPLWIADQPDDLTTANLDLARQTLKPAMFDRLAYIMEQFEMIGPIGDDAYRSILFQYCSAVPNDCVLAILQAPHFWYKRDSEETFDLEREAELNAINSQVTANFPNVLLIDPHRFATARHQFIGYLHFDRNVYAEIARFVRENAISFFSSGRFLP